MRKILASVLFVASFGAMPTVTFAYLSPEQVFGGQVPAPPTQREGDAVVQQQQQAAAERRAAEQQALESNQADPQDDYVPPAQQSESLGLFDDAAQYERRQERINDNNSNGPTIIIGGNGTVVDSNGNVLHSGAPLVTSTGPESYLALAVLVLAGFSTIGYALYQSKHRELTI